MTQQVSDIPLIWRRKKVEAETGMARSTIYAMVKAGTFPSPIRLGRRSVGWIGEEVISWLDRRIAQSRMSVSTRSRQREETSTQRADHQPCPRAGVRGH